MLELQIESGGQARYALAEHIGQGGEGDIYRAHDTQLNRWVAIKKLHYSENRSAAAVESALSEAKHLAALQHPNIVTIHDFIRREDGVLVVMEYLHGRTLQDIADDSPISVQDFAEFAKQALEGLICAHTLDMYHRDIKPSNIMIVQLPSGTFQVKILDFGLSRMLGESKPQPLDPDDSVFGSIFTMPPEQIEREIMDARSDLYSFGCACYFALTGKYPFTGPTIPDIISAHLKHTVKPLTDLREDIPEVLNDWVLKLIEREPGHRYQSASEAEEDLKTIFFPSAATGTHEMQLQNGKPVLTKKQKRTRARFIFAALLCFGVVGGITAIRYLEDHVASLPIAVYMSPSKPRDDSKDPTAKVAHVPAVDAAEILKSEGQDVTFHALITGTKENKSGTIRYLTVESTGSMPLTLVFFTRDGSGKFTKDRLAALVGRNVRVMGRVSEFEDAPQIVIKDLTQITPL